MRSSRLATLALTSMFVGYACLGASAHRNISTRTTSDDVRRCGDLRVEFDGEPAVTAEEAITVPAGAGDVLTVRPPQNGGVYVIGRRTRTYTVITCKAVAPGGTRARSWTRCTRPPTAGPFRRRAPRTTTRSSSTSSRPRLARALT